ncbi:MAG: diphthamide biosynthesis enzyme Dph2 [Nanohaloarchaea archaeon]|nr:diphthamide biosynthesis enzyme Dph2 [Candidatus Nanohaloarchaea archaeon]
MTEQENPEREQYNYESLDEILEEVKKEDYDKVGLQGPDGIKPELIEIADELREHDIEPVMVGASTFGACGIANEKVERMGADALIHVGHTRFLHPEKADMKDFDVYYLPYREDRDLMGVLEEHYEEIEAEKVGLVGVTQYMDRADKAREFLRDKGFEVVEGKTGLRTTEPGQVLGCDAGAAHNIAHKVDAFVFLGSGHFHPSQVSETGKEVYVVDPYEKHIWVEPANSLGDEMQAEIARVMKHKDKKKWGIVTSSKKGQNYMRAVEIAKEKLEEHGKEVYIFVEDRIFESDYKGYGIDIYVNCACPRMTKDWRDLAFVSPKALDALDEVEEMETK